MKISQKVIYQIAWALEQGSFQARQVIPVDHKHKIDLDLLNKNLMDYARIFRNCASTNKVILIED